jgi:hypothetical protein
MSVKFLSDIEVKAGLKDSSGALGASGQILSSTSGNVSWVTPTLNTVARDVQNEVKAGVAINKGQAVYVTGADGTNIIVGLASNTSEPTSSKTLGLLNATVAINGKADVVQIGRLSGLNTIGAVVGDPVWLGTNGNLIYGLTNKPYAPAHLVFIGVVTRVNASNGEIFITVQNGFELNEIHDVDLKTTVPINGDILGYNGTLWVNKTIAGWLGFTPANASGTTNYVSKFTGANSLGDSQIFDNGTNVGIGIALPGAKLNVNGVVKIEGNNSLYMGGGSSVVPTWGITPNGNNLEISGVATNTTGNVNFLNLGNVGIGTTTPGVKFVNSGGGFSSGPTLGSGVVGSQALLSNNGLYGLYSGVSSNGDVWHQVQRNDANSAVYNLALQPSGGGVYIGTNAPIYGTSAKLQILFDGLSAFGINFRSTAVASIPIHFTSSTGIQTGYIFQDATGVFLVSVSDYRLKEDLKSFNGLDLISKINVYDYKWKDQDKRSFGVMAHELQKVVPQAAFGEKDGERMQGVDYSTLVPILIQAVQELKAEIETLKNKI